MKRVFTILAAIIMTAMVWAQSPQRMSYQAVVRNSAGQLIMNAPVGMRISILQGTVTGSAVYTEIHTPTTNANGLVSIEIGGGAGFDVIDWTRGPYFLKVEMAAEAPLTSYTITGTSELMSVPYAWHATTSGMAHKIFEGKSKGEMLYWDGTNWVSVEPGEHDQVLRFCDGVPVWGSCPLKYQLSLSVEPVDGGVVSGEGLHSEGRHVRISAESAEGYEWVNWINETDEVISTALSFDYLMPSEDTRLTAVFKKEEKVDGQYGQGVIDSEGYEYKTVLIGNQEWMAENLRTKKFADGTSITLGIDMDTQTAAYDIFNYPVGNHTTEEVYAMYGALYNWYAVNDSRGLCPVGWRVPTESDWDALSTYMMNQFSLHNDIYSASAGGVGNALKSCRQMGSPLGDDCNTTVHPRWNANTNHYGSDLVNFNALPGGTISELAHSQAMESAFWWSATPENALAARFRNLFIETAALVNHVVDKKSGLSVRCVKE